MFKNKSLDGNYFKTSGFYIFHIPVKVPYKQIYSMADNAGLEQKEAFGPILESGRRFGFGWIAIEVEKPKSQANSQSNSQRANVIHIKGDYQMYEHVGPYKNLGQAYKQIMKEFPGKKEYLNLYLDDPEKVAPQNLRTQILFR